MTNANLEPFRVDKTAPPAGCGQALPPPSRLSRVLYWAYLVLTMGILTFLLWPDDGTGKAVPTPDPSRESAAVRLDDEHRIVIQAGTPLQKKLQVFTIQEERIRIPVVNVTGSVVASLRIGAGDSRDWQFNSPELLATYADWQKAVADIAFAKTQLEAIRELAENRVAAQESLVQRLTKLVAVGTETERELASAQNELAQSRIQGRKEVHEAETLWRQAHRTEAALRRQLEQAGLDATLLLAREEDIDIVVADVPETLLSQVRVGQSCEARFACLHNGPFPGVVRAISPVLSMERRALRVLFTIHDPDDKLRPGMFADIGLGTEERVALRVPAPGLIHVGRSDYLIRREDGERWRPVPVKAGEVQADRVEILEGVRPGDEVIGEGAILLKPLVDTVRAASPEPLTERG
ncbi:MAG: RND transporter [Myxococcales bacterium]|nr:RND transporter [Myxococcales bacterium]